MKVRKKAEIRSKRFSMRLKKRISNKQLLKVTRKVKLNSFKRLVKTL